jgi:hypothetical protein
MECRHHAHNAIDQGGDTGCPGPFRLRRAGRPIEYPESGTAGIAYDPYADEMLAAMEWRIRPGIWFFLPRTERAAMTASSIARGLIEYTITKSLEEGK